MAACIVLETLKLCRAACLTDILLGNVLHAVLLSARWREKEFFVTPPRTDYINVTGSAYTILCLQCRMRLRIHKTHIYFNGSRDVPLSAFCSLSSQLSKWK